MSIPISSLDHVALNVIDLEQSTAWYRKVFGFEIFHKWNTTWMIACGNFRIGLFQRPLAKDVGDLDGLHVITHFAFEVDHDTFTGAQEFLKEQKILFDGPEDSGIARSIFVLDPDGHSVEITTYNDEDPT